MCVGDVKAAARESISDSVLNTWDMENEKLQVDSAGGETVVLHL